MTFLALFFFVSITPIIFYKKESVSIPICIYALASIIGVIVTLSLLRIFNYDVYHNFLGFFYKLDTGGILVVPETLEAWKKTIIELSAMWLSGMQFLFSKIVLISLIIYFFVCLNCIMTYLDDKYCNSESITLAIISLVNLIACVGLSIASLFIGNSKISLYTFLDSMFAKVGIGIAFLGKALLILGIIAIAIKVIIWIIKDKRTTYYATKNHALELLSRLYLAVDEANDVIIKFYTNNPFASRYMIDVSEIKDNCKRIRKKMKAWSKEMLEDEEKHEAASAYYSSFLSFDRDIRETLGYLEEIFEEFSPTSVVGYLEYNDKLERCSDTYNDIYRKVEECNKYMEHYNDVMGHFPYDCIEFLKLEEIQF